MRKTGEETELGAEIRAEAGADVVTEPGKITGIGIGMNTGTKKGIKALMKIGVEAGIRVGAKKEKERQEQEARPEWEQGPEHLLSSPSEQARTLQMCDGLEILQAPVSPPV